MYLRFKNVLSCIFLRPWLGFPLGIWLCVSLFYFWWLIWRINDFDGHNSGLKDTKNRIRLSTDYSLSGANFIDDIGALCDTIHVSIVCMNKCARQVTPMLKSLFHNRQNPIHLHFVVDAVSEKTLDELFKTWDLPDVNYTCYNAEDKIWKVKWVPNSHYSGVYAMVKLIFPEILPESLTEVIVLDSDLTFLSDISEVWSMFRNMTETQFIGLVENESNWYLNNDKRWPALGRGYNTGVMLLNLKKIREKIAWSEIWHGVVEKNIPKLKQTKLADQDVINAIIKDNPRIVYNMSCQYNVQMSTQSLAKKYCYGEDVNRVKIVHWNSPSRYDVKLKDAEYFKNLHNSFVNMDGNLLRGKLHHCYVTDSTTVKLDQSSKCAGFRTAQHVKLRTHLYYMDYSYESVDGFDLTLVLQLSMDRLQFLERLVKFWDGPLSAAIYLSDCEVQEFESFIQDWSVTLSSRKNIGYHLVFKDNTIHYPVNYLRNVALHNVNTPYVFLMDVDFVPMQGLYEHLRSVLQLVNPYPQKKCLAVAAFETQRYRVTPPRDKKALVSRLVGVKGGKGAGGRGDVAAFRAREWPRGHRATNYSRWIAATAPYQVEWQTDFEPYLVVHRSVPQYDTRFSGFGWNKVSHSVELRAQGYHVVVLPGAFVVHTPHAPSLDITKFRANNLYRSCLTQLKKEFIEELKKKYNVTFEEETVPNADIPIIRGTV